MEYGNFVFVSAYWYNKESRTLDHKDSFLIPLSVCLPKNLRNLCSCLGADFLCCDKYGCRQFLPLES